VNLGAAALRDFMATLSEEAWAAGWMQGLEFARWDAVERGPRRYGCRQPHRIERRQTGA